MLRFLLENSAYSAFLGGKVGEVNFDFRVVGGFQSLERGVVGHRAHSGPDKRSMELDRGRGGKCEGVAASVLL